MSNAAIEAAIEPDWESRETGAVTFGEVPAGLVVVAGSMPSKNGINLCCALIVKEVDAQTRSKTLIDNLLRD